MEAGLTNMTAWSSEGRSRGVALFSRRGVEVSLCSYGRRHIDVDVTEENGRVWRLTRVYGELASERKVETWRMMNILGQQHQQGRPWLCLGDFNEILTGDEKIGGAVRPQRLMDNFRAALEACELSYLGYEGDKFTWRNHNSEIDTYICERLDRATTNAAWGEMFPVFSVLNGAPRHSDHRLVIVCTHGERRRSQEGHRGFRFEAWWLKEDGCSAEVQGAWEEGCMNGSGDVTSALRCVASRMQIWGKEVAGELRERLKKARNALERCMRAPVSEEKIRERRRS